MQVGVDLANFPVVRVDDCLQEKLNALKGHLTLVILQHPGTTVAQSRPAGQVEGTAPRIRPNAHSFDCQANGSP